MVLRNPWVVFWLVNKLPRSWKPWQLDYAAKDIIPVGFVNTVHPTPSKHYIRITPSVQDGEANDRHKIYSCFKQASQKTCVPDQSGLRKGTSPSAFSEKWPIHFTNQCFGETNHTEEASDPISTNFETTSWYWISAVFAWQEEDKKVKRRGARAYPAEAT